MHLFMEELFHRLFVYGCDGSRIRTLQIINILLLFKIELIKPEEPKEIIKKQGYINEEYHM